MPTEAAITAGLIAAVVGLVEIVKLLIRKFTTDKGGEHQAVPRAVSNHDDTSQRLERKLDQALQNQPRSKSMTQQVVYDMLRDVDRGQEQIKADLGYVREKVNDIDDQLGRVLDKLDEVDRKISRVSANLKGSDGSDR